MTTEGTTPRPPSAGVGGSPGTPKFARNGFSALARGTPWAPVGAELAAVRFIVARRSRRGGRPAATFREIAEALTTAGHPTKRGGRWHASTVRAVWERRGLYAPLLARATRATA
jgi:hypothetical protein